jgi:hypothetical protein
MTKAGVFAETLVFQAEPSSKRYQAHLYDVRGERGVLLQDVLRVL